MTGLNGTVVLQNNGGDDLTVDADGAFTFSTALADGSTYNVTVKTQPADQTCTASGNTGTIAGADVTDVTVTCSVNTYTVGGTVSGLASGTYVVLQDNGGDDLTVTQDGQFTFPTALADGSPYNVTVKAQPPDQTCTASGNTGTIAGADVTDVTVTCSVDTYTVGGTVTGLNGTVVLQNNGGDDLTITADGPFTFALPVADRANYNVTVKTKPPIQNCTVSNGSGSINGADIADVSLNCADKTWTTPQSLSDIDSISPDGTDADAPQVAMDDNGNAVIVWYQNIGSSKWGIFKSEYRNGQWAHPQDVTDNISSDGADPQVTVNNSGNAVIAWQSGWDDIFKSEYRNGAWTAPVNLTDNISPNGTLLVLPPQVAMDDNGDVVIVWRQNDGSGNYQAFKSEYRSGTWTTPSSPADSISPNGTLVYDDPQVAMDNNGNTIIVWAQSNGSYRQIYKSEYRNGTWTHPADLADNISPDGTDADAPQVAMDNNGNAIIVWAQSNGSYRQIYKSEYRNGTWTHPADLADNISPIGTHTYAPQVAMDDNGNAVIVWNQYDGSNRQIYKSEYRNGTWTHPADLADNISPDGTDADAPRIAMDNNGNAVIVWTQYDGSNKQIFKSEYRNGTWTHPRSLSDIDSISLYGTDADNPQVAMDDNGDAIIVWQQINDSGVSQIFKSEYR